MDKRLYVELPPFTGRNVPITEIAKAIGKDAHYVRIGIQQGILKFGVAMKMGDSNEFSYYCSDRKVCRIRQSVRKQVPMHLLTIKSTRAGKGGCL